MATSINALPKQVSKVIESLQANDPKTDEQLMDVFVAAQEILDSGKIIPTTQSIVLQSLHKLYNALNELALLRPNPDFIKKLNSCQELIDAIDKIPKAFSIELLEKNELGKDAIFAILLAPVHKKLSDIRTSIDDIAVSGPIAQSKNHMITVEIGGEKYRGIITSIFKSIARYLNTETNYIELWGEFQQVYKAHFDGDEQIEDGGAWDWRLLDQLKEGDVEEFFRTFYNAINNLCARNPLLKQRHKSFETFDFSDKSKSSQLELEMSYKGITYKMPIIAYITQIEQAEIIPVVAAQGEIFTRNFRLTVINLCKGGLVPVANKKGKRRLVLETAVLRKQYKKSIYTHVEEKFTDELQSLYTAFRAINIQGMSTKDKGKFEAWKLEMRRLCDTISDDIQESFPGLHEKNFQDLLNQSKNWWYSRLNLIDDTIIRMLESSTATIQNKGFLGLFDEAMINNFETKVLRYNTTI